MPFRTEEKLFIHKNNYIEFKQFLEKLGAKVLYPKRLIHSLYFDNRQNQMFNDSQEGCITRKKIRIRDYPNNEESIFNLEVKISSVEGRFKHSKVISDQEYNSLTKVGYIDKYYGKCMPNLEVSYVREYYLYKKNCRITIDRNILYNKYKSSKKIFREKLISCEIKSNSIINKSIILNNFPFISHRFSKYASAYQKLFSVN